MYPAILLFSCIGIYSVNNSPADVLMSAGFAVVGWALSKLEFETAPLLLGFVLGRLMEENLRRALAISRGQLAAFVQRPLSGALLAVLAVPSPGRAAWPERPITMIVPFAAGGPTDVVARIVAENMSRTVGQQIVVENVAGAGGTTGSLRAAQAPPDGYTIEMGHMGTHGAAPGAYPELKYDPAKDFEPIGLAAGTPILVVAKKDFPAKDFKEFVAYVK